MGYGKSQESSTSKIKSEITSLSKSIQNLTNDINTTKKLSLTEPTDNARRIQQDQSSINSYNAQINTLTKQLNTVAPHEAAKVVAQLPAVVVPNWEKMYNTELSTNLVQAGQLTELGKNIGILKNVTTAVGADASYYLKSLSSVIDPDLTLVLDEVINENNQIRAALQNTDNEKTLSNQLNSYTAESVYNMTYYWWCLLYIYAGLILYFILVLFLYKPEINIYGKGSAIVFFICFPFLLSITEHFLYGAGHYVFALIYGQRYNQLATITEPTTA